MTIWRREATLAQLNARSKGTMVERIGIRFTALNDDGIEAVMPVDERTCQPFGLLHGGASVTLAETLGSMAGYLCTEGDQRVVGVEINASHVRSARKGEVRGICRPVRIGRSHQVWQIEIFGEDGRLCCTSRLTTAVIAG